MVKKQHFVPRFYLKYFKSGQENSVWVYDKTSQKKFNSNINDIASQNKFYDDSIIENYFSKIQVIEAAYSEIENYTAPHYKNFINDLESSSFQITAFYKKFLAEFLTSLFIRTYEHRLFITQFNNAIFEQLKSKGITLDDINKFGLNPENTDNKREHLVSILSNSFHEEMVSILLNHMWIICHNITKTPFYTSDNPLNYYSDLQKNYGLSSEGIEISFPISPNYMLVICDRHYFGKLHSYENRTFQINKTEFVQFYNRLRILNATRQIFSCNNEFGLVDDVFKSSPEAFSIDRKRIG